MLYIRVKEKPKGRMNKFVKKMVEGEYEEMGLIAVLFLFSQMYPKSGYTFEVLEQREFEFPKT